MANINPAFNHFIRYSEMDIRPASFVIPAGVKSDFAKKIGKYYNANLGRNGNTTAYIVDTVLFKSETNNGDMIVEAYCPDNDGTLKGTTYGILRVKQALNSARDRYNVTIAPVMGTSGFHIVKKEWKNRFGETKPIPNDGGVYMQSSYKSNIRYFKYDPVSGSNGSIKEIPNPFEGPTPEYDEHGFRLAGSGAAQLVLGMQKVEHKH